MKLLDMLFAAMHVAETVNHARLAADPDYRDAVIRELCGEADAQRHHDNHIGRNNGRNESLPHAA